MERVVKRFLMHNQNEVDPKQNEFDGLKQDIQLIRYEMMNDVKKAKEENYRNMQIASSGLEFLAEEIVQSNEIKKLNPSPKSSNQIFKYNKESLDTNNQHFFSGSNQTPKKI
jgi:hypothetical protein